ncbi:MAG: DUF2254 domain-containing protein [Pseudomonadota bacterium]
MDSRGGRLVTAPKTNAMSSRRQWVLAHLSRRLWVGASLFALFAVLSGLLAAVLGPVVPTALGRPIGRETLETILQILASSMLVVATFSLSTMLQAYAAASTATTPRVARILMGDRVAQLALSTFIGAFLFSLVGLLALGAGLYQDDGRIVLFVTTVLVVALIVVTFVGWIDHAARLGRVGYGIERAADVATETLRAWRRRPHLYACPPVDIPAAAVAVTAPCAGYLQHLDVAALDAVAAELDARVHVVVRPGTLVDPARPVARVEAAEPLDDDNVRRIRAAFTVGEERSFAQDPRLGLLVLSEIAEKALSPGINDTGTAIEVLAALHRVLASWIDVEPAEEPEFSRIHVPDLAVDDLVLDGFGGLATAGAGNLAVGIRLQKTLARLAALGVPELRAAVIGVADRALERARVALPLASDVACLEALRPSPVGT